MKHVVNPIREWACLRACASLPRRPALPVPLPPSLCRHAAHRAADLSAGDRFATCHRAADLSASDRFATSHRAADLSASDRFATCHRAADLSAGDRFATSHRAADLSLAVSAPPWRAALACARAPLVVACPYLFTVMTYGTCLSRAPTATPPCGCPTSQASCSVRDERLSDMSDNPPCGCPTSQASCSAASSSRDAAPRL